MILCYGITAVITETSIQLCIYMGDDFPIVCVALSFTVHLEVCLMKTLKVATPGRSLQMIVEHSAFCDVNETFRNDQ